MQDYRRLLLVAILAWSASAVAVHAESDGSAEPCNAMCRFWLGRGDSPKEPPPAIAAEAPPVQAVSPDQEPETPPIVRMKRNVGPRVRRIATPPFARQPSDSQIEDGQGGVQGNPAAPPFPTGTASRPMDLTPDEAAAPAEPASDVRPPPTPPRRPTLRIRQARRPAGSSGEDMPVSLSVAEPQPGFRRTAGSAAVSAGKDRPGKTAASAKSAKPTIAGVALAVRPSAVAATSPLPSPSLTRPGIVATPPLVDGLGLRGVPPVSPARPSVAPIAAAIAPLDAAPPLDTGATFVRRTTGPAVDPRHLHDMAPGPRPAMTADSTATVPARRADTTNPDQALESLKETILRSAQEAVKQSEVHGF